MEKLVRKKGCVVRVQWDVLRNYLETIGGRETKNGKTEAPSLSRSTLN